MRTLRAARWVMAGVMCLAGASIGWQAQAADSTDNDTCLSCHGNEGFSATGEDGKTRPLHVIKDKFGRSVHGNRSCVECHTDITEIPHKKGAAHTVNCVTCHDSLWKAAVAAGKTGENARLGVVVQQIDHYVKSIHARPRRDDQSRVNANCYDCHSPHYIYPKGSEERAEWRLSIPDVCGRCHTSEREQYATSVHGKAVLNDRNPGAAVCSDCHTTHDVADPAKDSAKLQITKNCGGCHADSLKTYTGTYHGQVNTLGYAYTAKCFDCHGSHGILKVDDPKSSVYPDNRVKTCQKCHEGATKGFASFEPHGTAHDFARFPIIWIAAKFLWLLIAGTLVFFWSHTALWLFRELKERQEQDRAPTLKRQNCAKANTRASITSASR